MSDIVEKISYRTDRESTPKHFHDCHQILFVVDGEADLEINGRTRQVKGGTLIFISRFEYHAVTVKSEWYCRYVLRISPTTDVLNTTEQTLLSVLENRPAKFTHFVELAQLSEKYRKLFSEIELEYSGCALLRDYLLDKLLYRLLAQIYRDFPYLFATEQKKMFDVVSQIKMELSQNCHLPITLDSLCNKYHLSASHLIHRFKTVTGVSVMHYLKQCRITKAKVMLAKKELTINEIVMQCGFSDHSNFSRTFKQECGITPSQFRQRYN